MRVFLSIILIAWLTSSVAGDVIPNDPYFEPYQWYLQTMGVPAAWDYSMGSPNVTIAVLDTGIIFGTPELQGRYLTPISALTNGGPDSSATVAHGTWVTSTIGMTINDGIAGAGTGNFSILPITVTNSNGNASDQWIEEGIELAAQNGCRVITISVTALQYSAINAAVAQALAQNAAAGRPDFLVFMAAGNSNTVTTLGDPDLDNASQRLASDHLIMVAGTDENDQHWQESATVGSNTGPFVDISAPAQNILVANGTSTTEPYGLASGTSFAAPLAASAAALAFSINPDLTADQVQNMLFDTAYNPDNPDPGTPYWDSTYGWGRVDFGALAAAAEATVATVTPEPASVAMLGLGAVVLLGRRGRRR